MATTSALSEPGTLEESLDRHVKTFATRNPSWRVFELETRQDPNFARAQRRYLGTSGNASHADPTALMGASFTLTIIQQPAGHRQPMHDHPEEEVFFVLEGTPTVVWEDADGSRLERRLGKWDMVYNPPGQLHAVLNESDGDCFFQVMLGNPAPDRPHYQDPELRALQAADVPDDEARQ